MVKYLLLCDQGMILAQQGDLRGACNKFLASALAAPSVWAPHRYKSFMMHTMILRELHFKASPSDVTTLLDKFLKNSKEPPHFRVQSSFALGVVLTNLGDRETAADVYRQGLGIASAASVEEKARMVESDDGAMTVGYIVTTDAQSIESNLSILNGQGRTMPQHPSLQRRDFGNKDVMPNIGPDIAISVRKGDDVEELASVMQRVLVVGGNSCDGCGKTLKELGVDKFDCCARCELAYYCCKPCQKKAWRSGHKEACRAPDQIVPGDYMMLTGLIKKPRLNGNVGLIQGPTDKEGRWMVKVSGSKDSLSIATRNLHHIRPAK